MIAAGMVTASRPSSQAAASRAGLAVRQQVVDVAGNARDMDGIDDDDRLGEPFGFFDVLGGQQQAGARGGELAEHLPQCQPPPGSRPVVGSSRNRARGRGQQAGGDVQAAAHPPGVGAHEPPDRAGQVEPPIRSPARWRAGGGTGRRASRS